VIIAYKISFISLLKCNMFTFIFVSKRSYKHDCDINGSLNLFVCTCLLHVMDSIPEKENEMNFVEIISSARV